MLEQAVGTKGNLVTGDKLTIPVGAGMAGKVVDFRGRYVHLRAFLVRFLLFL